jgi:hypothetical protein
VPHSLCVQLLVEGNVSSFQEFFHLTHRHCSEPPAVAKDASASLDDSQRAESKQPAFEEKALLPAGTQAPSEPVIDPETGEEADVALRKYKVDTLLLFKELLTTVEKCQREGMNKHCLDIVLLHAWGNIGPIGALAISTYSSPFYLAAHPDVIFILQEILWRFTMLRSTLPPTSRISDFQPLRSGIIRQRWRLLAEWSTVTILKSRRLRTSVVHWKPKVTIYTLVMI